MNGLLFFFFIFFMHILKLYQSNMSSEREGPEYETLPNMFYVFTLRVNNNMNRKQILSRSERNDLSTDPRMLSYENVVQIQASLRNLPSICQLSINCCQFQ